MHVFDFLEADAAFTNAYLSELILVPLGEILALIKGAYVQADVLLLVSERNRRPVDNLFLMIFVWKRAVPEHVIREVRFETRNRTANEVMDKYHSFLSFFRY